MSPTQRVTTLTDKLARRFETHEWRNSWRFITLTLAFLEVPVGWLVGDVAFEPYSDAEYWLNVSIRIFLLLCYNQDVKRDGRHKKTTQ